MGKILTLNDYNKRILKPMVKPFKKKRSAKKNVFAIKGAKIGSKLRIRLPADYRPLTDYVPLSKAQLAFNAKVNKIAQVISRSRPWLAYSECEAIARCVIAELGK